MTEVVDLCDSDDEFEPRTKRQCTNTAPLEMWACERCTFMNQPHARRCEMCDQQCAGAGPSDDVGTSGGHSGGPVADEVLSTLFKSFEDVGKRLQGAAPFSYTRPNSC